MIRKEKYKELLEKGMDIGQYALLCLFGMNIELSDLFQNFKCRGFREALTKKGYLSYINNVYELTDKGKEIIDLVETTPLVNVDPQLDLFCEQICQTIEEMSLEKTKNKKIRSIKTKKIYNLSPKELKERLIGFFKKFGSHSLEDIRKGIIIYTQEILDGKIPYNLMLKYFIWNEKNGTPESELLQYLDMDIDDKTNNYDGGVNI